MGSSRVNSNGESDGYAEKPTPSVTPAAYRQGVSQSQLKPDSQRAVAVEDEALFRFPTGVDLETLGSSFGRLSFVDPTLHPRHHQQNPLLDNLWTNRSSASSSSSSRINGGRDVAVGGSGSGGGGGYGGGDWFLDHHQRERDMQRMMMNHYITSQNVYLNERSYGNPMTTSFNNGFRFFNGNSSQEDPYMYSRRPYWENNNNNGFGSLRNNNNGGDDNGFGSLRNSNNNGGYLDSQEPSFSLDNKSMGSIAMLARDRNSSIVLLKKIEVGSKEAIDVIFNDFMIHILDLMLDPVASPILQKVMFKCSSEQITQIVDVLTRQQLRFVSICTNDNGTRSVQALVKCLHTEEQMMSLVEAVSMGALTLSRNNYGKHVIVQCLKELHPSKNRNLLEVIAHNCYQIAIDQHGCTMLQECLGPRGTCQAVKTHLMHAIVANALRLCLDGYGNYVVQYVVELADPNILDSLVEQLKGNYAFLSRNKYGSHAVQKFLQIKCIDPRIIIYDLLPEFDTLLLDAFGNFVVQTAWFVCKDDLRIMLMREIERNRPLMRCNKYGNKILEKLHL